MTFRFRGLIAPEEPSATGDRRLFAVQSLGHRKLPTPVMFTRVLGERHQGAVAVGRLEHVEYMPGQGWIGEGTFLDPNVVPEVKEAIYLVQSGVSRPSVDLEPNLTFEVVPDPHQPGEYLRRIVQGTIMGFTFVPYSAFDQVGIEVSEEQQPQVMLAAVNTSSWRSMSVAPREQPFNFRQAINRLLEWSGGQGSKLSRAFLWRDPQGDPGTRTSYRLPIADIINGRLTLVPRAVFSAATFMAGGHGGLDNVISDAEKERIRTVISRIYDQLREQYDDPRVRPPWQRGGRQDRDNAANIQWEGEEMPTVNYTLDLETGEVIEQFQDDDSDGDCGNIDTPDAADLNTAARECAARRGWAMEGGRYPIRSKEMHGASDLSKAIRAVGRGSGSHDAIRRHIMKRARSLGLSDEIPENWTSGGDSANMGAPEPFSGSQVDTPYHTQPVPAWPGPTFQDQDDECPEGQVRNDDGECVEADSDSGNYTVTAAGSVSPPKQWFDKQQLTGPTPLTVDDDGRVFGHLATWNTCHTGIGNQCVTAPRSATGYAIFKTGEVVTADGSRLPVGKITLGTGHADPSLGVIPAAEHYDHTGSVVATVVPHEDQFGIQVSGSLVAGVDDQKLAELRRSPLSGDWRRVNGNLELVAALAVNAPGFPVIRASAEGDEEIFESLVAAGVVEVDEQAARTRRWQQLEAQVKADRAKALLEV